MHLSLSLSYIMQLSPFSPLLFCFFRHPTYSSFLPPPLPSVPRALFRLSVALKALLQALSRTRSRQEGRTTFSLFSFPSLLSLSLSYPFILSFSVTLLPRVYLLFSAAAFMLNFWANKRGQGKDVLTFRLNGGGWVETALLPFYSDCYTDSALCVPYVITLRRTDCPLS